MSGAIIAAGKVVSLRYTLRDSEGEILDATDDEDDPFAYLHGADNIVPGLERALSGRTVGEWVRVVVPAEDGYGARDGGEATAVPRSAFPDDVDLELGGRIFAHGPGGEPIPLWIVAVADDEVMVDPNHPLAGLELHFDVEVTAIRDATPEEREHGHPHGADGHGGHD
jgi:FKBP-type peptidyl-prolyl cis-trans isomerase SlyD